MKNSVAERTKSFRAFAEKLTKVNIFITQVDPDALSSAFALRYALKFCKPDMEIFIFYCGYIGHPMNRGLMSTFKLSEIMHPVSSFDPEKHGDKVIFVDSAQKNDIRLPVGIKINPIGAIDHHLGCDIKGGDDSFVWVEDGLGAAATIFVELLTELGFKFEGESLRVARMLAVGIHTDTNGLIRATPKDRNAYVNMANLVPTPLMSEVYTYPVPLTHFDNWEKALKSRVIKNARLVANIGFVCVEEKDMLAEIADRFILLDGISFVLVWAIVGDTAHFSARNTDSTRNLSAWVTERLKFPCGAKHSDDGLESGGGAIKLGNLLTPATKDASLALIHQLITSSVLEG